MSDEPALWLLIVDTFKNSLDWMEHEKCLLGFNILTWIKPGLYDWVPAALSNTGGLKSTRNQKADSFTHGARFVCGEAMPQESGHQERRGAGVGDPDKGPVPRKNGCHAKQGGEQEGQSL